MHLAPPDQEVVARSNDLFLLLLDLSQMHSRSRIIERFLEGLNALFAPPALRFADREAAGVSGGFPIATQTSSYGSVVPSEAGSLSGEEQALLHHATRMLAVILDRLVFEEKLETERSPVAPVADGRLPEPDATMARLREPQDAYIGLVEDLSREIAEHKRTVEDLRDSEERYHSLFASMAEMVVLHEVILDDQGEAVNYRILDCNPAFSAVNGITRADAVGRLATDVYGTETAPYLDEYARVALTGERCTFTTYYPPMDKHFEIRAVSPKKGHFATITIDITERQRAEEALRSSEFLLRMAGRMTRMGGWRVGLATNRVTWSDEVAAIHEMPAGFSPTLAEGIAFYAPEYRARIAEVFDACAREGTPYDEALQIITGKGRRVWVRTLGEAVRDGSGAIVAVQGGFQDITEHKQAQAEREQLLAQVQERERLAAVGQLAAGIAHDFNNIMATIVLYSQMMARSEALAKPDRERASVITEQGWHAARLVEQILDFGRRAMLDRRSCDLLTHLRAQAELLGRTLPESIAIELDHGEDDYVVYADSTRMQVMVTNLAVNARDAMPDGGTLRLSLERIMVGPAAPPPLSGLEAGKWVRLRVADTGTGIAPEALSHIFEPFYTTKEPGKGSGLGLAQVYGIVAQHEGQIGVESQVGEGTVFSIYLPAQTVRMTEPLSPDLSAMPQGKGETVLVVEDEDVLRSALREILEMLDYRALEATDGESALALIEAQGAEIALVLSDVVMPKMGGVALLQALREKRWETPVILLTGHPVNSELEALRAQGLSDWVTKPPTIERLAQALSEALHS